MTTDRDVVLDMEGMTCASCVHEGRARVGIGPRCGVGRGQPRIEDGECVTTGMHDLSPLVDAVAAAGYRAHEHDGTADPADEGARYRRLLWVSRPAHRADPRAHVRGPLVGRVDVGGLGGSHGGAVLRGVAVPGRGVERRDPSDHDDGDAGRAGVARRVRLQRVGDRRLAGRSATPASSSTTSIPAP